MTPRGFSWPCCILAHFLCKRPISLCHRNYLVFPDCCSEADCFFIQQGEKLIIFSYLLLNFIFLQDVQARVLISVKQNVFLVILNLYAKKWRAKSQIHQFHSRDLLVKSTLQPTVVSTPCIQITRVSSKEKFPRIMQHSSVYSWGLYYGDRFYTVGIC